MIPIDNAGILHLGASSYVPGFVPSATYAYNSGASTLTITDTSTIPGGDDLAIMHIYVTDAFGAMKYDKIVAAAGNKAVNVSTLNPLEGLSVRVTFVTDNRLIADASAYNIGVGGPISGSVRYTNKVNC